MQTFKEVTTGRACSYITTRGGCTTATVDLGRLDVDAGDTLIDDEHANVDRDAYWDPPFCYNHGG